MNSILMAALSAGVALGILLVIQGIRGKQILPSVGSVFPDGTTTATATAWAAAAFVIGLMVLAVTRWIGAAVGMGALVVGLPWFFGGSRESGREIERTQAIATWTEMIRDNLAGAAGLEQALLSTADIAPASIAKEVKVFSNRLDGMSVVEALVLLGRDLHHPAADLVVVSLANASRMEGRDLGSLLTRLSESIRADVRMRLRIEVGRARVRMSSKIVLGVTLLTVAMIYFTSRDLLAIYDTTEGQFWLLAVFGLFLAALWMMNYFARVQMPERFTARLSAELVGDRSFGRPELGQRQ
ncbi:MAG: type II secretion system F family protein [Acidimicrobiales bacterium]